jgi:O-antigen/teichoic acid export membrane protein
MSHPVTSGDSVAVVKRGARVNAFGVVARIAQPVMLGLVTRWYGPEQMGVFLLAAAAFETLAALSTSGLQDAVVAYVSPTPPESDESYRVLASAFLFAMGAALLGAVAVAGAATLAPGLLPQAGTASALWRMVPALPLYCFTGVVASATRARFSQAEDVVLNGVSRPLLIIVFAWAFSHYATDAPTLAGAYVSAHIVLAGGAAFAFARRFSWRRLGNALRDWPMDRALVAFTIPQNLNQALYALTQSASVLALGTARLPAADVALFGAATGITTSLRHVRLVFTSAMAPVTATLYVHRRIDELQRVITRTVRWSLGMAIPVSLAMVLLRNPLLHLFHPTYHATWVWMALLVVAPLLNSIAGFSSNVIVMGGFVRWNLFNTFVAAMTTYGFTWVLAPSMGVMGAAVASAAAGTVVATLQIVEARILVGVTPRPWDGPEKALAPSGADGLQH